jgi:hypothetical protein
MTFSIFLLLPSVYMFRAAIVTIRPYHALAIIIDNCVCATEGSAYVNAREKQEDRDTEHSEPFALLDGDDCSGE